MIETAIRIGVGPLPLLRSSALPSEFVHGFTTRLGGTSPPPFDSLNLGLKRSDSRANVEENRRRLHEAVGGVPLYWVNQVHGASVVRVRASDPPHAVASLEADALISDAAGLAIGVHTADCVPVLMADPRTGAFAAIHAGWRGTAAGVVPAALRAMIDAFDTRPADVRVGMGPAIGPCCFEVGPEVAAAIETATPGARAAGVVIEGSSRPHVNLKRALFLQLQALGVPANAVDESGECTSCVPERFYSYRRDHGNTGTHMGFIRRG